MSNDLGLVCKSADRAISESHKEFFQHMRVACDVNAKGEWIGIWVPSFSVKDSNANGSIDCLDVWPELRNDSVYGRADRRYMIYLDPSLQGQWGNCSGGFIDGPRDTSPGILNRANSAYGSAMLQSNHWDHEGSSNASTSFTLHELGHSWGLVHSGSPGSDGADHTKDYPDMMNAGYYFPNSSSTAIRLDCRYQVTYVTPLTHFDSFMDCGGDDYWNDRPGPGNWLCTHFNLASDLLYFQPRSDRRYC